MASFDTDGPRIVVAGTSGSGKTTLAGQLAELLGLPYVEIDSLYHGPGWIPRESFVTDVDHFTSQERWVTEWQYGVVRDLLAERATMLIWIDLPHRRIMRQVIARTIWRRLRRLELWNGNREGPLVDLFLGREHIIRWSWTSHAGTQARIRQAICEHPHLVVVRLRSRREVDAWVATLDPASDQHG